LGKEQQLIEPLGTTHFGLPKQVITEEQHHALLADMGWDGVDVVNGVSTTYRLTHEWFAKVIAEKLAEAVERHSSSPVALAA
jgi:hypothetical protein